MTPRERRTPTPATPSRSRRSGADRRPDLPGTAARRLPTASDDVELVKVSDDDVQRHHLLSGRTKARKQALDVLYEAEAKNADPVVVLDERCRLADPPVRPLAVEIVRGVVFEQDALDRQIGEVSAWPLDRMAGVDRNLARIAAWEIGFTDTPAEVAISEAVLLADELSTDESASYLNGLLAQLARTPAVTDRQRATDAAPDEATAGGAPGAAEIAVEDEPTGDAPRERDWSDGDPDEAPARPAAQD